MIISECFVRSQYFFEVGSWADHGHLSHSAYLFRLYLYSCCLQREDCEICPYADSSEMGAIHGNKNRKKPYHHGLTAFEAQPFQSSRWRLSNVWSFLKEYLWFHSYLSHDKTYWCFLYIAHIGFVSLIIFQAVCIATALGTFLAHDQAITAEGLQAAL